MRQQRHATATPPGDLPAFTRALDATGTAHAIEVDPAGRPDLEWLAFADLLAEVPARTERLAVTLGGARRQVAASLLARSLVPLVVTPVAVAVSRWSTAPDLRADALMVGIAGDVVTAVGTAAPALVQADADWVVEHLLDGVCEPLIDRICSTTRVGSRHLWGNAALAIAAPFAALLATGAHDGRATRDALLAHRHLRDLVEIIDVSTGTRPVEAVRRRTCCLLTKAPEPHATMCGTCSLRPREEHLPDLAAYYRALSEEP
jgi:ferric iron reductase protein FhuF